MSQAVDFPFVAGVHEETSPRMLQPPQLQRCENVRFRKQGEISRRPGLVYGCAMGNSISGPHAIASTGRRLVVVGHNETDADQVYVGDTSALVEVTGLSPATAGAGTFAPLSAILGVTETAIGAGESPYCDMAVGDGNRLLVWYESAAPSTLGGKTFRAELQTLDGATVCRGNFSFGAAGMKTVRVVAGTNIYWVAGGFTASTSFRYFSLADNITSIPDSPSATSITTVSSTPWDIATDGVNLLYVAQTAAGTLRWGQAGGSTYTVALAGTLQWCRIYYSAGRVYVAWQDGTTVKALTGTIGAGATYAATSVGTAISSSGSGDLAVVSATDVVVAVETTPNGYITLYGAALDTGTTQYNGFVPIATLGSRFVVGGGYVYAWTIKTGAGTYTQAATLFNLGLAADLADTSGGPNSSPYPIAIALQGRAERASAQALPSTHVAGKGHVALLPGLFAYNPLDDSSTLRAQLCEAHTATNGDHVRTAAQLGSSVLLSGGFPRYTDGYVLSQVQSVPVTATVATGSGSITGTFGVRATTEWYDADGTRYQSAASVAETVMLSSQEITVSIDANESQHIQGGKGVVWMTEAGGTTYYRAAEAAMNAVNAASITISSISGLSDNEQLYSNAGQEPDRYPPPSLECVGVAARRFWGGHGRRVYYSQPLDSSGEAPQFCSQVFYESLPADVTAIGELDETPVVFTSDRAYIFRGGGPDRVGVGGWQVDEVSSEVGCIEPRSVVQFRGGLMFQSRRGIELMSGGGAAPVNIGQAVEDTLAAYPYITGAVAVPSQGLVLFSCATERATVIGSTQTRVLAYDYTIGEWSVWSMFTGASTRPISTLGRHNGVAVFGNEVDPGVCTLSEPSDNVWSDEYASGSAADYDVTVMTGSIRPNGITGHCSFDTVLVEGVGGYGGSVATTIELFHGDDSSAPSTQTATWFSGTDDGSPEDIPWTRLYKPRRTQSSSLSVRLSWPGGDDKEGPRLNGMGIWLTPERGPVRLGAGRRQ